MSRHRTLTCIAVEMADVSGACVLHPAIRFSHLAGPKVPFLYNQNQELGEELLASHLDSGLETNDYGCCLADNDF
jgi:hypothetical protein